MNRKKYQVIYDQLKADIRQGIYCQGQLLPSEMELCLQFETSRETLRKSLQLLQNDAYIQKIRGKGSIVIYDPSLNFELASLTSFQEINAGLSQPYQTEVAVLETIKAKDYPDVKTALQLRDFDTILRVVRLRKKGPRVNIVDIDFFNPKLVPGITEEVAQTSIYRYIEKDLNLVISHSAKTITFQPANQTLQDYFQQLEPAYVALVEATVFLGDGQPFQLNQSHHRPSSFKFTNFSRRQS
ncbi:MULTISPECIES: trehalose operon repressor [unclassified Streptococcus]|uniref:trehalose operon repressor n=1 Tax=unclassified Streptococcus TaxID=2608887 RepID=UPI001071B3E6|nr:MULTISPECIES: trehalose operon repressor [unclassified Streptococcus]MBF0805634.1 trehalose operon repressor [Streptococcus sp. 19428wA2_WM07]TFU28871.1 trehalose operon repressor [Streptococcus sp. WM07]